MRKKLIKSDFQQFRVRLYVPEKYSPVVYALQRDGCLGFILTHLLIQFIKLNLSEDNFEEIKKSLIEYIESTKNNQELEELRDEELKENNQKVGISENRTISKTKKDNLSFEEKINIKDPETIASLVKENYAYEKLLNTIKSIAYGEKILILKIFESKDIISLEVSKSPGKRFEISDPQPLATKPLESPDSYSTSFHKPLHSEIHKKINAEKITLIEKTIPDNSDEPGKAQSETPDLELSLEDFLFDD